MVTRFTFFNMNNIKNSTFVSLIRWTLDDVCLDLNSGWVFCHQLITCLRARLRKRKLSQSNLLPFEFNTNSPNEKSIGSWISNNRRFHWNRVECAHMLNPVLTKSYWKFVCDSSNCMKCLFIHSISVFWQSFEIWAYINSVGFLCLSVLHPFPMVKHKNYRKVKPILSICGPTFVSFVIT